MRNNQNPLHAVRNLNQIELQSYLDWYSQLQIYPILVRFLTLNFSNSRLEKEIFARLGEVPKTAIDQVRIFCKKNLSTRPDYNSLTQFIPKLLNSLYISFLLNSWSRKYPKTANINKANLRRMLFIYKSYSDQKMLKKDSISILRFVSPDEVSVMQLSKDFLVLQEILLSGAGLICGDNSIFSLDPAFGECEFQAGLWDKVTVNSDLKICTLNGNLKTLTPTGRVEMALDLTGRCSSNFWHFVCEYLPRIVNANDLPTDLPILISSETPLTCQALLSNFFPKNEKYTVNPNSWVEVGKLISPKFITKCLDSGNEFPEAKFSWVDENYLRALKKMNSAYVVSSNFSHADRIYLKRNSRNRTLEDEYRLEDLLINYGFEIISPETLSIDEQISIFRQAKILVGVGGAIWANLIFANPELIAISLLSTASAPNDVHLQLSQLLDINFHRVICPTLSEKDYQIFSRILYRDYAHSSFVINDAALNELKKILNEV